MPFFSIIVPIYNAEDYLQRCVNSVLSQSYKNFEVLLVDDGSADKSWIICQQFALEDVRVKSFQIKHAGVSSARNYALLQSLGHYITFLDADDWLDNRCLEICGEKILGNDLDILQFSYVDAYDNISFNRNHIFETSVCSPETFIKENNRNLRNVCANFFRRQILITNRIEFNTILNQGEDTMFFCEALMCCNKIQAIKYPYYYYYHSNKNSATTNPNKIDYYYTLSALYQLEHRYPIFHSFYNETLIMCVMRVFDIGTNMKERALMRRICKTTKITMEDVAYKNRRTRVFFYLLPRIGFNLSWMFTSIFQKWIEPIVYQK